MGWKEAEENIQDLIIKYDKQRDLVAMNSSYIIAGNLRAYANRLDEIGNEIAKERGHIKESG